MTLMENLSVTLNFGFTRPRSAQVGFFLVISVPSLPPVPISGTHVVRNSGVCAVPGTGCLWLTSPGLFAQAVADNEGGDLRRLRARSG